MTHTLIEYECAVALLELTESQRDDALEIYKGN